MPSHDPYRAASRALLDPPTPLAGRAPHMLAVVHRYLPEHNAGAEHTLHAVLRDLVEHGWECLVVAAEHRGRPYRWDGVEVVASPPDRDMRGFWEWADVGVTHLRATRGAVAWSRRGRPLVHLVHNHTQLANERVQPVRDAALVVWNSAWIADLLGPSWAGQQTVVHPPVRAADYATTNPDRFLCGHATLLNVTKVKGGDRFWRLAERRPDLPFLGVEGSYYLQEQPPDLPNARLLENVVDVVPVYEQTRVLLMPSVYESWGRAAVEAMASGVPVVASDTPGLREALTSPVVGACGLLVEDDDEAWLDALATLDDPGGYRHWSERALARSAELDALAETETKALREMLLMLAEGRSLVAHDPKVTL